MIPTFRQQVTRGLTASAVIAWALAWGLPALWSLLGGVDIHEQNTVSGQWLSSFLPLAPNTVACLRDLLVAALPGAGLWAVRRPAVERWAAPRAWRPEPLLLAYLSIMGVQSVLISSAIRFDWWSRPFHLLLDALPAVLGAGALAVLARRLGPVRRWDAGALAAVGALATAACAQLENLLTITWMFYGPRPLALRAELPTQLLYWPLVLGLAALACRWVATRTGPRPRGAYALAVLAAVALPVALLAGGAYLYLLPMLVLAMLAAGRHLRLWSERPGPGFGIPVPAHGG